MAFSDLPIDLQNIYMTNFEFFGKLVIIYGFLIFCYLYITKLDRKIPDGFFGAKLIKRIFYLSSILFLTFSPFSILMMYPQFSMEKVLVYMFITINTLYVIIGTFIVVNVYFYSPLYMLKFMGIEVGDKEVRKTTRKIDRFLDGKYGKT